MTFQKHRVSLLGWFLVACCGFVAVPALHAQRIIGRSVNARTVLHQDETRTESVTDPIKKQQTETTFDSRGVVIAERVFLLNENGDPTQGVIYDGAKNLIARVIFYFDDLGRVVEERCVNTRNEIFRRVIRQYDKSGNPMPPQAFDFPVNAPNMKVGTIDFTNMPALPPKQGPGASQPGQAPQAQPGPSSQTPPTAPPAEEKKKKFRFFWQKKEK